MKCMHCGADLPEDQLICPSCGREIQIVPDYNPLDDMLTAQLKGGITQTMSLHLGEQEKQDVSYSGAANPVYERRESVGGETRCVGNSGSVGRRQQETVTRRGRDAVVRRSDVRPATGRVGQREDAREQTRRAYEEERRLRRMHSEAVIPFLPVWYQYKILPLHDKFLHFRTALQSRLQKLLLPDPDHLWQYKPLKFLYKLLLSSDFQKLLFQIQ